MIILTGCDEDPSGPNIIRPENNSGLPKSSSEQHRKIETVGTINGNDIIFIKNGPTLILNKDCIIEAQRTSCSFSDRLTFHDLQLDYMLFEIDYDGIRGENNTINVHHIMLWRKTCIDQQKLPVENQDYILITTSNNCEECNNSSTL